MTEGRQIPGQQTERAAAGPRPVRNWDAVTAIVAVFIGVLALAVSAYTAYLQRQQVRAEVWPNLLVGFHDPNQAISVHNKGVGPAIVDSVRVWVDGKPRRSWAEVLVSLDVPAEDFMVSTISRSVISPGERVFAISLGNNEAWQRFRAGMAERVQSEICYCSTLGECRVQSDRDRSRLPGQMTTEPCPAVPENESFSD